MLAWSKVASSSHTAFGKSCFRHAIVRAFLPIPCRYRLRRNWLCLLFLRPRCRGETCRGFSHTRPGHRIVARSRRVFAVLVGRGLGASYQGRRDPGDRRSFSSARIRAATTFAIKLRSSSRSSCAGSARVSFARKNTSASDSCDSKRRYWAAFIRYNSLKAPRRFKCDKKAAGTNN